MPIRGAFPEPDRRTRTSVLLGLGAGVVVLVLVAIVAVRILTGSTAGGSPTAGAATSSAARPSVLAGPPLPTNRRTGSASTSTPGSAPATRSPRPSRSSSSAARATVRPTASPSGRVRAASGPRTGLATNSLYRIHLTPGAGHCRLRVRAPKPPLRNARLAPYLRKVVGCLGEVFSGPLATRGFALAPPKVRTYRGTIQTPCGRLGSVGSPSYYCSVSRTIYWPVSSDDEDEAYTYARLGYVALTAHEYGHHLQTTTGMMARFHSRYAAADRMTRYALNRRLELQAQCFEGVFLSYAKDSVRLTAHDRADLRVWHSYTGDDQPPKGRKPDHGTSRAQFYWLRRGLDDTDFGRCNTWSAPASRIK